MYNGPIDVMEELFCSPEEQADMLKDAVRQIFQYKGRLEAVKYLRANTTMDLGESVQYVDNLK